MASVRVIRVETERAREREDKRVSPPARVSSHLRVVQLAPRVTQANYVSVCQTKIQGLYQADYHESPLMYCKF